MTTIPGWSEVDDQIAALSQASALYRHLLHWQKLVTYIRNALLFRGWNLLTDPRAGDASEDVAPTGGQHKPVLIPQATQHIRKAYHSGHIKVSASFTGIKVHAWYARVSRSTPSSTSLAQEGRCTPERDSYQQWTEGYRLSRNWCHHLHV